MRRILLALAMALTVIALPGVTFAISDEETVRLLKHDADQGNANAQGRLGYFCGTGRGGLAKDDLEAARLFNLASDQTQADARVNLGYFYETGHGGLAKDDHEAVRLYRLAADQGNATAQSNLGVFYRDGRGGLTKDDREALRLFKLAADQGNPYGQNQLGGFFRDGGGGLAKDDREAARLFKLAADQGNANARTALNQITQQPSQEVSSAPSAHLKQEVVEPSSAPAANLPSVPERRVALVIGNSAYQTVSGLPNTTNDARAIAEVLKADGFTSVRIILDMTRASMIASLNDFQREADTADWAVVYYAGHGLEVSGANYLVPIDAKLGDDRDIQDEAVSVDRILSAVENAKKLRLVMLDACRDNPFLKRMHRSIATRSISRGLAAIE